VAECRLTGEPPLYTRTIPPKHRAPVNQTRAPLVAEAYDVLDRREGMSMTQIAAALARLRRGNRLGVTLQHFSTFLCLVRGRQDRECRGIAHGGGGARPFRAPRLPSNGQGSLHQEA
jgi:hypothetical protein